MFAPALHMERYDYKTLIYCYFVVVFNLDLFNLLMFLNTV